MAPPARRDRAESSLGLIPVDCCRGLAELQICSVEKDPCLTQSQIESHELQD